MKKRTLACVLVCFVPLLVPSVISAQQGSLMPRFDGVFGGVVGDQQTAAAPEAPPASGGVQRAVKRFGIGIEGGAGFSPELVMVGAHGTFAPVISSQVEFRPGIELGLGEVTALVGINLDALYVLPRTVRGSRWTAYFGAGPNFALSHRSFETDTDAADSGDRFDFSDTAFDAGVNFIAGVRNHSGVFVEIKATAYSVSVIRLLAGFDF